MKLKILFFILLLSMFSCFSYAANSTNRNDYLFYDTGELTGNNSIGIDGQPLMTIGGYRSIFSGDLAATYSSAKPYQGTLGITVTGSGTTDYYYYQPLYKNINYNTSNLSSIEGIFWEDGDVSKINGIGWTQGGGNAWNRACGIDTSRGINYYMFDWIVGKVADTGVPRAGYTNNWLKFKLVMNATNDTCFIMYAVNESLIGWAATTASYKMINTSVIVLSGNTVQNTAYVDNVRAYYGMYPPAASTPSTDLIDDIIIRNNSYNNHAINFTNYPKAIGYNTTNAYTLISANVSAPTFTARTLTLNTTLMKLALYNGSFYNYSTVGDNIAVNCTVTTTITCLFNKTLAVGNNAFYFTGKTGNLELNNVSLYPANLFNYTYIPVPYFNFVSQDPADISNINAIGRNLNVTYNIYQSLEENSIKLYFKTNSSLLDYSMIINGTKISGFMSSRYVLNSTSSFRFSLDDNDIYPATYNRDDDSFETNPLILHTLTGANDMVKVEILNISVYSYNILEIMANSTAAGGLATFYYCNSTYTTGLVANSNSCVPINTLTPRIGFNHTHVYPNKHQVIPFAINNATGSIGSVKITDRSFFVLQGVSWTYYSIANLTRAGLAQTTGTGGTVWTSQTYTPNLHIHQYNGTDSFNYYVCANSSINEANCSSMRSDLIDLANLPPTAPSIISPTSGTYAGNIQINYTASTSPNGYIITQYNITLTDENFINVLVITANNSQDLSYLWNSSVIADGNYRIAVHAYDSLGQKSTGFSDIFNILNNPPPPENADIKVVYNTVKIDSTGEICGYGGLIYSTCTANSDTDIFSFETYGNVTCKLTTKELNFSYLDSLGYQNCTADKTTSHQCAYSGLSFGINTLFISCKNGGIEMNATRWADYKANTFTVNNGGNTMVSGNFVMIGLIVIWIVLIWLAMKTRIPAFLTFSGLVTIGIGAWLYSILPPIAAINMWVMVMFACLGVILMAYSFIRK